MFSVYHHPTAVSSVAAEHFRRNRVNSAIVVNVVIVIKYHYDHGWLVTSAQVGIPSIVDDEFGSLVVPKPTTISCSLAMWTRECCRQNLMSNLFTKWEMLVSVYSVAFSW